MKYNYHRKYIDSNGNYRVIETRSSDGRKRDITNTAAEFNSDNVPFLAWLAAGGEFDPANDEPYVEAVTQTPEQIALAKNSFAKFDIRRAFRSLGIESTLDSVLDTPVMVDGVSVTPRNDWNDALEIFMDDPVVVAVLALAEIDINIVKLEIAGLNNV